MNLDVIIQLMERAEQSAFSKIEVQQGDLKILLERGTATVAAHAPATRQQNNAELPQPDDKGTVRSPISGVFYLTKEPGAAPFIQVGSKVSKGDALCIIEAMKTMNEIRAPKSGVISSILITDGAVLAARGPLFLLSEGN